MKVDKVIVSKFLWISLFAISMGYLECIVRVYVEDIYYPGGFNFPLKMITAKHLFSELTREISTLFMILGVGVALGRSKNEKLAWFLYVFAVWDIFYYVALKSILNWPSSLFTWDLLFLIPTVWTGPVLAPVISSITMIILSFFLIRFRQLKKGFFNDIELVLLILGAIIQLLSYFWDYLKFVLKEFSWSHVFVFSVDRVNEIIPNYIPQSFPWIIFIVGEVLFLIATYFYVKRNLKSK